MTDSSTADTTSEYPLVQINSQSTIRVCLTYSSLDIAEASTFVKDPSAGAVVLFAGTTRNNFSGKAVTCLVYQSYGALALRTLSAIASTVLEQHSLTKISITHRLGEVPVGEESILIAVSATHRGTAWRGAEEALERCKERAEIWKLEEFADDGEEAVWRANAEADSFGHRAERNPT